MTLNETMTNIMNNTNIKIAAPYNNCLMYYCIIYDGIDKQMPKLLP
jgi:hypothetical protein